MFRNIFIDNFPFFQPSEEDFEVPQVTGLRGLGKVLLKTKVSYLLLGNLGNRVICAYPLSQQPKVAAIILLGYLIGLRAILDKDLRKLIKKYRTIRVLFFGF